MPRGNLVAFYMVNFYANFTVNQSDRAMVASALTGRNAALIARGRFTLVAEEVADTQDSDAIEELAQSISAQLGALVLAVMNHDDDILMYWLVWKGEMLDAYNSSPDYFTDATEPSGPVGGKPGLISDLCGCEDQTAVKTVLEKTSDDY